MEERKFSVGDKVYCKDSIGTVTRITPKGTKIEVDFRGYTDTFNKDGVANASDPYYIRRIRHLTPELERHIQEQNDIKKCRDIFSHASLSAEQAREIMKVLGELK